MAAERQGSGSSTACPLRARSLTVIPTSTFAVPEREPHWRRFRADTPADNRPTSAPPPPACYPGRRLCTYRGRQVFTYCGRQRDRHPGARDAAEIFVSFSIDIIGISPQTGAMSSEPYLVTRFHVDLRRQASTHGGLRPPCTPHDPALAPCWPPGRHLAS